MLPALTRGPTVIQLLLVITVPLGYIHCTTGGMLTSTVQVSLRTSPDAAVPDSEMVTVCSKSGEVGRLKGMAPSKSYSAGDCINHVNHHRQVQCTKFSITPLEISGWYVENHMLDLNKPIWFEPPKFQYVVQKAVQSVKIYLLLLSIFHTCYMSYADQSEQKAFAEGERECRITKKRKRKKQSLTKQRESKRQHEICKWQLESPQQREGRLHADGRGELIKLY